MSSSLGNGNITFGDGTTQSTAYVGALGYGQTWQNVTASRVSGTTYYNTTGRPIYISLSGGMTQNETLTIVINGVTVMNNTDNEPSGTNFSYFGSAIVPAGASYVCTSNGSPAFNVWSELR